MGQGKHINSLDPGVVRILKLLRDFDRRDESADQGFHFGMLERERDSPRFLWNRGQHRAGARRFLAAWAAVADGAAEDPEFLVSRCQEWIG